MSNYSNPEKVEQELRDLKHWCVYRAVPDPTPDDPDRKRKLPFRSNQPAVGCASTRPEEWSSYEDAVRAALNPDNKLDGPGWMLFHPYIGADFDHVRNKETGEIEAWVLEIIKRLNSCTELSPSGEGLHVYVKGSAPEIDDPKGGLVKVLKNIPNGVGRFEVYARDRYLTVTGRPMDPATGKEAERPTEIRELSNEEVSWLYAEAERKEEQPATAKRTAYNRLQRFHLLSQGEWSKLHPSQSEADLEYCIFLAEANRGQRDKIDQDFRRSKLMRQKWERSDYRKETIDKALEAYSKNGKAKEEVDPNAWRDLFEKPEDFENLPPMQWVVEKIAQEEEITLIGALPKHTKTWFMLSIVASLLTGEPLFGYFTVPKLLERILYLIPEAGRRSFYKRIKLMGLEKYLGSRLFVRTLSMGQAVSLTDPRILKAAEGADVFIDTVVRHIQGDENQVADIKHLSANLFTVLGAGARSVWGAHHSPKAFGTADYMSLENMLRGSGDLGAMLSNAYGLKKLDEEKNLIHVECLQGRDLDEIVKPFQVQGRPYLNQNGRFKLVKKPGECGSLGEEQPRKKAGRKEDPEKRQKLNRIMKLHDEGKSEQEIAGEVGVTKSKVHRWIAEALEECTQRRLDNQKEEVNE